MSSTLTMSSAIDVCRAALRDQTGDSEKTTMIREAIRVLVSDFLNNASINETFATVTATVNDPVLDLSGVSDFRAEQFVNAQIDFNPSLEFVDYESLSRDLKNSSLQDTPEKIAFYTATTAYLAPRPEEASSIKIKYSLPAGDLSDDTNTINIPGHYLRPALWWGVPALLRGAGQEGDEGDRGWRRYRAIIDKINGVGVANRGNFVIDRDKFQ